VHPSPLASEGSAVELLRLLGGIAVPGNRATAAVELGRLLGGETLILFAADPELDVVLPAPGFAQVMRGAPAWRAFLQRCRDDGAAAAPLIGPDGVTVRVEGIGIADGTAAALLAPGSAGAGLDALRPVLPLLGRLFRTEREITSHEVRARRAVDEAHRATVLTGSLQAMRQRLEEALRETAAARGEARLRAEHAETLAVELHAQTEQLQEAAVELEMLNDELTGRTEEAERARAAADEANRAKSEFLASMSHELRTPINAVIGYAELLDMGITGPVTEDQQRQLQRIRASSAHLLALVNDVLDLSKVEAGRMTVEHERVAVAPVVAEGVALVEGEAATRELLLENACGDPGATFFGDADRVRQIIVNLLSNAVKFTPPGGRITVAEGVSGRADAAADVSAEGPWRWVSVRDTGIGMERDELDRIFRPFMQAESGHTRRTGGTGLGLTISRQFARLMGGDLTVDSEKGNGSTFTLWLPIAPSAASREGAVPVGAAERVEAAPAGVFEVGALAHRRVLPISEAFCRRVRGALAEETESMDDGEILDHAPIFISDLAGQLMKLGRDGIETANLREATEVQCLIAKEHGADRARRGWTAHALEREFEILRHALLELVGEGAGEPHSIDAPAVTAVIDRLVRSSRSESLRSFRAAAVAAVAADPRRS
jgi:signal transduction histidine kinase